MSGWLGLILSPLFYFNYYLHISFPLFFLIFLISCFLIFGVDDDDCNNPGEWIVMTSNNSTWRLYSYKLNYQSIDSVAQIPPDFRFPFGTILNPFELSSPMSS